MSTQVTPIAGASSNVDGGSSAVGELEPVGSLPTGGPDSSADNTPVSEGGEGDEGHQPEAGARGTEGDGRLIPKWIRAMKEADPEGYKAAKADFFSHREYKSVYPTVQAAREANDLIQSLGGKDGAARLQEDASFFKEAAGQFLKGDPAFVKDLWEEDAIAAALHVPPMLDEFKARDFEGYKSTIARIWANDFKNLNFAPALQDLRAAIAAKDIEGAMEVANSIQKWHDSILDTARKAEDPRVKSLLAERNKRQETQQQAEHQEFLKGYRTDTTNDVVTDANRVFDSFFRDRKIDKDDRTDLLNEAVRIANRAVEADSAFIEQRNNHLKRGDAHSARKLTKARYAQEMTEAVKKVARRYGLVSGQARSAQSQQTQQNKPGQQPQAAQGFTAVNERPQAEHIDHRRTTSEMIMSGRAILNDGRKVDWSKLKKAQSA